MVPQWIIEKKRDGQVLTDEEIRFFINGYTNETIPDYQMAAMAMAIYLKGMTPEETAALTDTMMHSGVMIDTSSITLPKVDKHSTGGIGDKVSIILAPLVACADIAIPMISGRGLGITGGTLDKLAAIPGMRTDLSEAELLDTIHKCGFAMIGQTGEIAPADKKPMPCAMSPARSPPSPSSPPRLCARRWPRASIHWSSTSNGAPVPSCAPLKTPPLSLSPWSASARR